MKIYANKANENWVCDRMRNEFYKHCPHLACDDINQADVFWAMAPWHLGNCSSWKNKNLLISLYHIVPEKFNKKKLAHYNENASAFHVICEKTKEAIAPYVSKPIFVAPFWLNHDIFFPLNKAQCRQELNLPPSALIIGSFQRDTEGKDKRSPKLEKGPDQFCDIIEEMHRSTPNLHVLLGGWRRQYITTRLDQSNIPYTQLTRCSFEILNKMYNAVDVYITASRQEGGPQAIPEAIATRTPIISTNVGCAPLFLPEDYIFDHPYYHNSLQHALKGAAPSLSIEPYKIPQGFDSFINMFKSLIQ